MRFEMSLKGKTKQNPQDIDPFVGKIENAIFLRTPMPNLSHVSEVLMINFAGVSHQNEPHFQDKMTFNAFLQGVFILFMTTKRSTNISNTWVESKICVRLVRLTVPV